MIYIQTVLVYTFLFVIFYYFGKKAGEENKWTYMLYPLFFFAILFGLRYGVGVDHLAYLNIYKNIDTIGIPDYFEAGFSSITRLLHYFGVHSIVYFCIIAFVQLFFILYAIKDRAYIFKYFAISFVFSCVWLTFANGIRQILAVSLFVLALKLGCNRKPLYYVLLVLAASMFHSSAIILLAIYPLIKWKPDVFKNVKLQIISVIIAVILGNLGVGSSELFKLEALASSLGYEHYFSGQYDDKLIADVGTLGVGFFVILFIDIFCVYYSNFVKRFYNSRFINVIYSLYYIGVIIHYLFISSPLIQRMNYYFYGLSFVFVSYLMFAICKNKKLSFYLLLFLHILLFVGTLSSMIENTSAFYFVWQEDMYNSDHLISL